MAPGPMTAMVGMPEGTVSHLSGIPREPSLTSAQANSFRCLDRRGGSHGAFPDFPEELNPLQ